jgi:hypothetical protein
VHTFASTVIDTVAGISTIGWFWLNNGGMKRRRQGFWKYWNEKSNALAGAD